MTYGLGIYLLKEIRIWEQKCFYAIIMKIYNIMRRLSDVFYVKTYFDRNEAIYYGMEFNEFMSCVPNTIHYLLLLDTGFTDYLGYDGSYNTRLVIV